jgi:hypothetical protein
MPKRKRLPSHMPTRSKYVIKSQGRMNGSMLMHRYVESPEGHRVVLAPRLVPICGTTSRSSNRAIIHVRELRVG